MTLRIGLFYLWNMDEDFGKNILKCITLKLSFVTHEVTLQRQNN